MTVFTVEAKFADANNDGVIAFGAANKKKYGTGTAYYLGERDGMYHYGTTLDDVMPADPTPPPPPPPPPPAPPPPPPPVPTPDGPEVVNHADGSVTLSQNGSSVTVNRNGGIMALSIGGTEYIAVGATVQGFMLVQGGAKVRQSALMAPTITNGVNDGAHWRGSTADMALDQFIRLESDRVKFAIKADCTGAKPITRYDWWADPNPSETDTQKLSATASEARSGDVAIRSTHPAAFFYVAPVLDPRVGTTLPIKTVLQSAKTLDRSVAVGFLLNITQGNSDTITFEVRK